MAVDYFPSASDDNTSRYTRNPQMNLFSQQVAALRALEKSGSTLEDASFRIDTAFTQIRNKTDVESCLKRRFLVT